MTRFEPVNSPPEFKFESSGHMCTCAYDLSYQNSINFFGAHVAICEACIDHDLTPHYAKMSPAFPWRRWCEYVPTGPSMYRISYPLEEFPRKSTYILADFIGFACHFTVHFV